MRVKDRISKEFRRLNFIIDYCGYVCSILIVLAFSTLLFFPARAIWDLLKIGWRISGYYYEHMKEQFIEDEKEFLGGK